MTRIILRGTTYDYKRLRPVFFEIMDSIDGSLIAKGTNVLIKPNLLNPAAPRQAVLTHPLIVKAAVEYVLQRGAHPIISDSPAVGSFDKIMKVSGIEDALAGFDVDSRIFAESVKIDIGEPFRMIEIAKDAVNADVIINLPKLKTHSQMLLTLGVKNMFGCIVGYRKPEWHLRTGVDRVMFAKLLVLLYQKIKPSFTILDGILAMEGEGPGSSGTPRDLGILIGSGDAHAVDSTVCKMIGLDPDNLLTLKVAREMGVVDSTIVIDGHLPFIDDFKLPDIGPLVYGPRRLHGFIRRHLLQRPVSDASVCRMCRDCGNICPAGAISFHKDALQFDYDRCIRCYCCIEICPYGALHTGESFAGMIIRKFITKHF